MVDSEFPSTIGATTMPSEKLSVSVELLAEAANRLLSHVDSVSEGGMVHLSHDFYWVIDRDEWVDPYVEPSSFSMGQFSSDIDELEKLVRSEEEPISYALVWLGALLSAIGSERVA